MSTKFLFTMSIIHFILSLNLLANEKKDPKNAKKDTIAISKSELENKINEEATKRVQRFQGDNATNLFRELMDKEKELRNREAELEKRLQQLKINESELVKKIKKLEQEQQEIIGCIKKIEENENERVNKMVSVVSNMRPAKAAEILSVQDLPIAVKIIGLLDPQKASKIFNLMDKEISARIQKTYLTMKK